MPVSVDQFGKALVSSALMTTDEVKGLWAGISASDRPKNGDEFAQLLVDRGKLTAFQAKEILAGRGSRLVMGDYVVLQEIGAGGMGEVYKARHRRMERIVALKVMSTTAMKEEASVKRFQREVRAAAKLEHPNIVTAYDSGESGSVNYLVMQFVDGGDLSSLVKKDGPLSIEQAADYVVQAAKGLAFAHSEGVIHRDIKPANLLVDKKGVVKILDMGLARIESADDGLTATEQVMGTVDYMSPEQAANTKGADARADIYSLGCTLWFLLTGKKLYDGDTMIARLMAHRDGPLPSLVKARDDASWALEQAFHKMIAKRAEDRFQTMEDVITALAPFSGGDAANGAGSSFGMASTSENAELASFLKSVGPVTKQQVKLPASKTNVDVEATEQFDKPDAATDPKSEIVPRTPLAPEPPTARSGTARAQVRPNKKLPLKLIAVGVFCLAGVAVAGMMFVTRQKNDDAVAVDGDIAGKVVITQPRATATVVPESRDRVAAIWALSHGVSALRLAHSTHHWVPDRDIADLSQLTAEPFVITHVRFKPGIPHPLEKLNGLATLAHLDISDSKTSDAEFMQLRDVPGLLSIKANGTALTDRSLQWAASRLPSLQEFDLRGVGSVTDAGLKHLEVAPKLKTVRLAGTSVTSAGVAAFQKSRPDCVVEWQKAASGDDYALEFDGAGGGDTSAFEGPLEAPLTIEAFVTPAAAQADSGQLPLLGFNRQFSFSLRPNSLIPQLIFGHHENKVPSYFRLEQSQSLEAGKTAHLAAVWTPNKALLFINGKLAGEHEASQSFPGQRFTKLDLGRFFQGRIDEIRISNIARYSADFTPQPRFESDANTLALYHCDDGQGPLLTDASSRREHVFLKGADWVPAGSRIIASTPTSMFEAAGSSAVVPPPGDYALNFDGKSDVFIPNLRRDDSGSFTLECWVRNPSTETMPIVRVNGRAPIQLHFHNRQPHGAERNESDKVGRDSVGPSISENQWTHLAYVVSEEESRLFVDGKSVNVQTKPAPGIMATARFGDGWLGTERFDPNITSKSYSGEIDELRISKVARYTAAGFTPSKRHDPDADTLALYHFDEGTGDVLADASGNNHHGKITGAKWVRANGGGESESSTSLNSPIVDLLSLADVARDAFVLNQSARTWEAGGWTKQGAAWLSTSQGRPMLRLPHDIQAKSYSLVIEAEIVAGNDSLFILLPVRASQCALVANSSPTGGASKAGIAFVDGKAEFENETTVAMPTWKPNVRHKIEVDVDQSASDDVKITARIDGETTIRYTGPTSRLSIKDYRPLPQTVGRPTAVGSFQTQYLVHLAHLRENSDGRIRNATLQFDGTTTVEIANIRPAGAPEVRLFETGLAGWNGDPAIWKVVNNELVGTLAGKAHVYLSGTQPFRDFEASFEVRLTKDANAGMQFRSSLDQQPPPMMIGPQAEIGAGGKTGYAGLWWQARTGRVEQAVEPAVFEKLLKPDDYNAMTVRCVGKHVRIMLNGTPTVDREFDMPEEGLLGWQLVSQGSPAEMRVRNVRVRDLTNSRSGEISQ